MSTIVTEQQQRKTESRRSREFCEIPFEVISGSSTKLRRVPMSSGLCVPKGVLRDVGTWAVEGLGGAQFPAQVEVLNRWNDGSVRWLLMHFVAGRVLPGRTSCTLVRHKQRQTTATMSARWEHNALSISVHHTDSTVDSTLQVIPEMFDADGQRLDLRNVIVRHETSGPVRGVSVVEAEVRDLPFVKLQLRLEAWPVAGLFRVETRLRNTRRAHHKGGLWDLGDPGSLRFNGLHLNISSPNLQPATLQWKAETELPVRESSASENLQIVQFGSGSAAWANTNHVDADGDPTVRNRGYEVHSAAGVFRGYRCEPVVVLSSEHASLSVAVPEFREQFPGSISVQQESISVGLFPTAVGTTFELQGGEQKTQSVCISTQPTTKALDHLRWTDQQPRIVQSAKWFRTCGVFSWLPESIHGSRVDHYLHEATTGNCSFAARRDRIDEYGWRNYGDVPADHEQPHYAGNNTIISHYNNQFDLIFGGILNLVLSGDAKWFDLFDSLARHMMDIDLYHTSEDRSCFNGGLFWHTDHYVDAMTATHRTYSRHNADDDNYGGGPCSEHNYTTGLLFYHFLTGSPEARASVISLADWVINMDDGSKTIWGLLDSGDTGLASATVSEEFQGPGRGAGNSINSLVDAWILTGNDTYIAKAEQLIHRVVHPHQDCDELHLIDAEGHWSYTVCMTALGRYMAAKLDAEQLDEHYEYARQSLVNYGRWMAQKERPTLSEPELLEYPTEAWAAQDFRKANVLRIAASCTDDAEDELQMRRKADELNDAAWNDLYSFGRQHLTARCLSIVMTEGLRDVFHRTCRPEYMPPADVSLPQTEWTMFVPQKLRVKKLLKNPLTAARAVVACLNPHRWLTTLEAVKRRF